MCQERATYYAALESAQEGTCDITPWLAWFLGCVTRAMQNAETTIDLALRASRFWARLAGAPLNDRQRKVLRKLVDAGPDGFAGGLSNANYRAMTKASHATAARDLAELVEMGALWKSGGGRSVRYGVVW